MQFLLGLEILAALLLPSQGNTRSAEEIRRKQASVLWGSLAPRTAAAALYERETA
jgi:hypothetical protein